MLNLRKKAEYTYTAQLLSQMTQGLDRVSANFTVDGAEAVVNFQGEGMELQQYHVRITPMSSIESRQETVGERGEYSWGPEGPPTGITNAVRLNMKKKAQLDEGSMGYTMRITLNIEGFSKDDISGTLRAIDILAGVRAGGNPAEVFMVPPESLYVEYRYNTESEALMSADEVYNGLVTEGWIEKVEEEDVSRNKGTFHFDVALNTSEEGGEDLHPWDWSIFHPAVRLNMRKKAQPDEGKDELDLAGDPHTPPEVLERLAKSEDNYVRGFVAENPSTPAHVLRYLSQDLEWYDDDIDDKLRTIPWMLSKNPNTPFDVLTNLYKVVATDVDQGILWGMIMIHPNIPLEMAEEIFMNDDARKGLKGPASPHIASITLDRKRIENRLRELEQRTGTAFFEGETFDDYEKQERKRIAEILESVGEAFEDLESQPWKNLEDIISPSEPQEGKPPPREKLPEEGEKFDLPENLPPGIAVRLNMKKKAIRLIMRKKSA